MLERTVEKYLVDRCKEEGIYCRKVASPGRRSVPDRILIYEGMVLFLELKAPGKKPSRSQEREMEAITKAGVPCDWADSREGVDWILTRFKAEEYHPW